VMHRHYEGFSKEMDKKNQCRCAEFILEQWVNSQAGLVERCFTGRKSLMKTHPCFKNHEDVQIM
jgi:hypothetical protein